MDQSHGIGSHENSQRVPVLLLLAAAAAMAGAGPALAEGRTAFNPAISLGWGYTDNVSYLDTEGNLPGDTSLQAGVRLPIIRRLRRGTLNFSYQGSYFKYSKFDTLDYYDHRASLGAKLSPRRDSSFTLSATYARTQSQGNPASIEDLDLALARRTSRDSLGLSVGYEGRMGGTWRWSGSVGGARANFHEIAGSGDVVEGPAVEDRSSYVAGLGFRRAPTPRSSMGLNYDFQRTDLDVTGTEDVHRVTWVLDRKLGPKSSLGFRLGAFTRSQDRPESLGPVDLRSNGLDAGVSYSYGPVGPVTLGLSAGIQPSSGGALQGTSTDATVGFTVTRAEARKWNWQFAGRYNRRESSDRLQPTLNMISASSSVERSFLQVMGIRVGGRWARQSSSGTDSLGTLEGSFYAVTAGVVWYPLGRLAAARQ